MIQEVTNKELNFVLVRNGILDDKEMIDVANKILETVTAQEKSQPENQGLEEQALATKYAERYFTMKNGIMNKPTGQATPQAPSVAKVRPSVPAAEAAKLQQFQENTRQQRAEASAKTSLLRMLGDKPYPGTYMAPNMTMKPKVNIQKFEAYADQLVQTEENKRAYEEAMNAIRNNTEMAVYIPAEDKWNPKNVGIVIQTPSETAGSGQMQEMMLPDKEAISFVAVNLNGYIPCDANHPGCRIGAARVAAPKAQSRGVTLTPRLIYVNKKEAYSKPDQHEFISRPKMNGNQPVTKEGTVRSALSFEIIDKNKLKNDGTPKTRKVRVSGRAMVPVFERTQPKYVEIFGEAQKNNNVVTAPSKSELSAHDEMIKETLFALQQGQSGYSAAQKKFIEQFSSVTSQPQPQAANQAANNLSI